MLSNDKSNAFNDPQKSSSFMSMDEVQPEPTVITDGNDEIITNLPGIADVLFSKPPQEPRTIQLGLEELSSDESDESTPLEIIRMLSVLGMQRLFGHSDPMRLSEQDYSLLKRYINSMGYDIRVYCNDGNDDPWQVAREQGVDAIRQVRIKYSPLAF